MIDNNNNKVIKHKIGLVNLAEELGNISRASKVRGFREIRFIATEQR